MISEDLAAEALETLRAAGWHVGLERFRAVAEDEDRGRLGGWLSGRAEVDLASGDFADAGRHEALRAWACIGRGFKAVSLRSYADATRWLDRAAAAAGEGDGDEVHLRAATAHARAVVLFHRGDLGGSLELLSEALEAVGPDAVETGIFLDTMGMVHTSKGAFGAARELYELAAEKKKASGQENGLAITYGNLGRLFYEWGHLDRAETYFLEDLKLVRGRGGPAEAGMYNWLGRVALAKGATDQSKLEDAEAWLEEAIRCAKEAGWTHTEGFARKDLAMVHLELGDFEAAERELDEVDRLLDFEEGHAHASIVRAAILRRTGRLPEAEREALEAFRHFDAHDERSEATRAKLEEARILRDRRAPRPLVLAALRDALERAEMSRRPNLLDEIEAELRAFDEAAYCRHAYRRVRGRLIEKDSVALLRWKREALSVAFFDMEGFTQFSTTSDPELVMLTLNDIFADLVHILEEHEATVNQYLGDGFMALFRGPHHARRAVTAALELAAALERFNRPRMVLGLKPLRGRIGINTGEAVLGNVGTPHKIDFTAVGPTTNKAARLQSAGEVGRPCIGQSTFDAVRKRFEFSKESPREVDMKGLGVQKVWDVVRAL